MYQSSTVDLSLQIDLISFEKEVSLYIFKEMEGERAVTW